MQALQRLLVHEVGKQTCCSANFAHSSEANGQIIWNVSSKPVPLGLALCRGHWPNEPTSSELASGLVFSRWWELGTSFALSMSIEANLSGLLEVLNDKNLGTAVAEKFVAAFGIIQM